MADEFKKRQVAYKHSIGMILKGTPKIVQEKFQFQEIFGNNVYRVNLIGNVVDKYVSNQKPYSNITLDDGTGTIRLKAFADNAQTLMPFEIGDTVKTIGIIRLYNEELYIVPEIVVRVDTAWLLARKLELLQDFGSKYEENLVTEKQPDKSVGPNAEQMDEVYSNSQSNPTQVRSFETIIEQKIKPVGLQGNLFGKSENQNQENQEKDEPIIETKIGGTVDTPETKTDNKPLREQILEKLKENDSNGGIELDKLILDLTAPVDEINKLIIEFLEEGIAYEPRPGKIQLL
ncbi:OB-fold nucleic acid binding domain-containing protein [Candidatus Pacearchaeota archaeon]|nr:OB-fold nucleic acid binding domain-containing protein [Candidatus Pacearchaeota archaeon]